MDWLTAAAPFVTGLLGFLGGNGVSRLRLTERLRAALAADLAIYKEMPDGPAREELRAHIDGQARLLVSEHTDNVTAERTQVVIGLALAFMGGAVMTKSFDPDLVTPPGGRVMGMLIGLVAFTVGGLLVEQAVSQRRRRMLTARAMRYGVYPPDHEQRRQAASS